MHDNMELLAHEIPERTELKTTEILLKLEYKYYWVLWCHLKGASRL